MRKIAIANKTRVRRQFLKRSLWPRCRALLDSLTQLKNFCTASEAGLNDSMAAYEPEPAWDEYDWERFLQQQDHKTEKYMQLLEKYIDHPQRDQIIAREMGWTQLLNEEEGDSWNDEVDAM